MRRIHNLIPFFERQPTADLLDALKQPSQISPQHRLSRANARPAYQDPMKNRSCLVEKEIFPPLMGVEAKPRLRSLHRRNSAFTRPNGAKILARWKKKLSPSQIGHESWFLKNQNSITRNIAGRHREACSRSCLAASHARATEIGGCLAQRDELAPVGRERRAQRINASKHNLRFSPPQPRPWWPQPNKNQTTS